MSYIEKLEGQQEIFLKNVQYNISFATNEKKDTRLLIQDQVNVDIENKNIKIIFSREVKTAPFELFVVNVVMGCLLPIKEEYLDDSNWNITELQAEIKEDKHILGGLISRVSLLISQITSSCGQRPIITPPNFIEQKNEESKS